MTMLDLIDRLKKDGKKTGYIQSVFLSLTKVMASQESFDIHTQGADELMRIVFKRTCYARSIAGYLAALHESGYLTMQEYRQVASDMGVTVYE